MNAERNWQIFRRSNKATSKDLQDKYRCLLRNGISSIEDKVLKRLVGILIAGNKNKIITTLYDDVEKLDRKLHQTKMENRALLQKIEHLQKDRSNDNGKE